MRSFLNWCAEWFEPRRARTGEPVITDRDMKPKDRDTLTTFNASLKERYATR